MSINNNHFFFCFYHSWEKLTHTHVKQHMSPQEYSLQQSRNQEKKAREKGTKIVSIFLSQIHVAVIKKTFIRSHCVKKNVYFS